MILVFGGTTEGRLATRVLDEAHKDYFYSTKGDQQKIESPFAQQVSGGLDQTSMTEFCKEHQVSLIIDAAHPFATQLHQTIAHSANEQHIPVIRLERLYPERNPSFTWFDSYEEACEYFNSHQLENLLILTGINTMSKLKCYWEQHTCTFRILDRDVSRKIASKYNFPEDRIIYYQTDSDEVELFKSLHPNGIMTKESGYSGGFEKKTEAATELGIPVFVIKRPALPADFILTEGEHTLRKAVERILPDFFELKSGFTTGSSATAATKAALTTLLNGTKLDEVSITLPNNERVNLPIHSTVIENNSVTCGVIKVSGDDPDVTNGYEICANVKLNYDKKGVYFLQGIGVGTVTLPGLGIEIGEPAINSTPRMMMKREIFKTLRHYSDKLPADNQLPAVEVTISVPEGEELATRTLNGKLGIQGGISIIGTSGIVRPFSAEAFKNSICREIQVAKALGCQHIIINSGAKSEKFLKALYPDLPPQAFIHYGNYIGASLEFAAKEQIQQVTMGVMIGKGVKLAEGYLDTHSKHALLNKSFLQSIATAAKCSEETIEKIGQINLARQLWKIIPENEELFFKLLIRKCQATCSDLLNGTKLNIVLINENGNNITSDF